DIANDMGLARPSKRCAASRVPRSVCGSLTTCQWTTLQHRFAPSLRHQFLIHANDPNEAWYTLRSDALRLLPLVMFPRCVPHGRAWRCVLSRHFRRTVPKPFPSCVEALTRLSWCGPVVILRAATISQGPPRAEVVPPLP